MWLFVCADDDDARNRTGSSHLFLERHNVVLARRSPTIISWNFGRRTSPMSLFLSGLLKNRRRRPGATTSRTEHDVLKAIHFHVHLHTHDTRKDTGKRHEEAEGRRRRAPSPY